MGAAIARLSSSVFDWSYRTGLTGSLSRLLGGSLTVLCYHRVVRSDRSVFQGFRPNISASPELFARQMDHVRRHYDPLTLGDIVRWLDGEGRLPRRPLLVTFDDGYRDNGRVAWPIMRERGIPAVIFLATDHIGSSRPFLCDFAAFCFHATAMPRATVPLLPAQDLMSPEHRERATARWVGAAKALPPERAWAEAARLATALGVSPPVEAFADLCLSWTEVADLARQGVEFGGHTLSHPILANLPEPQARTEITGSLERIRTALDQAPLGFAYPNGSRADYFPEHEVMVRDSGCRLGFSLEAGPMRLARLRQNPAAIRRIYVGEKDEMPRFAAKLAGIGRFRGRQPRRRLPWRQPGGVAPGQPGLR